MTDVAEARDKRWIALVLLCVAQFVVVLDASIVNVALPTIKEALDFSEDSLPWVVNAYVLTFGGFLLLGGRLADLLGRRRLFMAGLVLFALASLAGGLASDSGQLIAARAVQGLGAAILSPAALSIVATTFKDGAERNKALGIWGAVAGSGGAAGVLLGGVLTEELGWEWVLWVNVPIGIIAAAIAPTPDRRDRDGNRDPPLRRRRRDDDHARPLGLRLRPARRRNGRLGLGPDDRHDRRRADPARRLRRDRAPLAGARWCPSRSSASARSPAPTWSASWSAPRLFSMFYLHLPLHAAGARLQPDQGRPLLPAAGGHDHPLGRDRLRPGHQSRLQADPRDRHGADRARPPLVHPDRSSTAASSPTSSAPPCSPPSASASPSSR